jgi:SAM-dependent methyltransferase
MTGTFPSHAVTKTVGHKFAGIDFKLHLSHALFSSNRVDDGTMLLLKTLAQQDAIPIDGFALDVGCGVGSLAVSLAGYRPELQVTATDRLALACAFTAENARLNRVSVTAFPALMLDSPVPEGGWNLILSNLPAKAGEPVLEDFLLRSQAQLAPGGRVAIVIVATLADWAASVITASGAEVLHVEGTPAYRTFHFRPRQTPADRPVVFPGVYARGSMDFAVGKASFHHKTVYGLSNFDALDYRWKVTAELLPFAKWKSASLLVWEPVQGHIATYLSSQLTAGGTLHVAGNDLLALNTSAAQVDTAQTYCVAGPDNLAALTGEVQGAVFQVHSEPEVAWVDQARDALLELLPPGAPLLVNGTSTDLARFLEVHKGLRKQRDEKYRGWRSVLFLRS